jgi:Zn finger protein HypA/HybF involved in hydrogenase expression
MAWSKSSLINGYTEFAFSAPSGAILAHLSINREVATMKTQWWCVSCLTQIQLDSHGRCSNCGSDAVDRIEHGAFAMNIARNQSAPRPRLLAEAPRMVALTRGEETQRY